MKYDVISAFVDRRDGRTIQAGSPVPAGLDWQTIKRLVKARCLEPIEEPKAAAGQQPPSSNAPSLFPETDGDADDGTTAEGEEEADDEPEAAPAPAPARPRK
jgi:hypothetical protein